MSEFGASDPWLHFEKIIISKVKFEAFPMPFIAKNQHDSYFFLGPDILGIQGTFGCWKPMTHSSR